MKIKSSETLVIVPIWQNYAIKYNLGTTLVKVQLEIALKEGKLTAFKYNSC